MALLTNRPYRRNDGQMACVHGVSPHDESPTYRGPYDHRCSNCWLGYAHTEDFHALSIEDWEAAG